MFRFLTYSQSWKMFVKRILSHKRFLKISATNPQTKLLNQLSITTTLQSYGHPQYNMIKRYYENDSYWNQRWSQGTTIWHKFEVDPILKKHYQFLSSAGRSVFVPLCGKSLDMKWLASKGHCVVGCDIIELAAQQFFIENNIPYKKFTTDHFTVYESTDDSLMIKLLVGDVFKCTTTNNTYDTIWDCNALVAINPEDRDKYITTLHSLLKPNGNMLLSSYEFEQNRKDHSPFSAPPQVIKTLFDTSKFEVILKDALDNSGQFCMKYQIPSAERQIYYIKKLI